MNVLQNPLTLTDEELRIHKIMRKKIVFGTDVLGILLNKNLIHADNIFIKEEILKYRIFRTWRELAYFIGYTKVNENLDDEGIKIMLQRQLNNWVSQGIPKDKILFGISQKFDESICSFLCNYDDVSCLTTEFMEDYIMFYNIDRLQYKSREDFQIRNRKDKITEKDYRKNLMEKIYRSISLNNNSEKQDINFYTRAHSLIKQENNLSSEISAIKDDDMKFKRLEFEEIFKYYKPFGPKKTGEQGIQEVYGILLYSEIHRMMKQFQELINRCKKEIFKEDIIPIITKTIKTQLLTLRFEINKTNEIIETIKELLNADKKEMSKEKIILNVKSKLTEILMRDLDKPTTINIIKNVETKIKEVPEDKFFFFGVFQIIARKNDYKDASYLINFEKMKKMGYRYIGYIFNHGTDPNYRYSHYIAIYIDIEENIVYYYDPHNDPIFEFYKRFIIYLFLHNGISYGNVRLVCETNKYIAHQTIEGNCGTFASMGLFALASGIKYEHYIKLPINANFIAQLNNVLFNDRLNYKEY